MRLYIIRHGVTEWNKAKRFQGQQDIPLAKEGIELAKQVGEKMKEVPIDLVITSPLKRARQTAELVTAGMNREIPMEVDSRIGEISFGIWEGQPVEGPTDIPEDYMKNFYHSPRKCCRPEGGENFDDVCKRTKEFYQSLLANEKRADKNILISTHGAASRCLLCNFYEDKEDIWRGGVPVNCSVTIVEVKDGKATIIEKDKEYVS